MKDETKIVGVDNKTHWKMTFMEVYTQISYILFFSHKYVKKNNNSRYIYVCNIQKDTDG